MNVNINIASNNTAAINLSVLVSSFVCISSKRKRPAKKRKDKDADDGSASEDDSHDTSNIEKAVSDSNCVFARLQMCIIPFVCH